MQSTERSSSLLLSFEWGPHEGRDIANFLTVLQLQ